MASAGARDPETPMVLARRLRALPLRILSGPRLWVCASTMAPPRCFALELPGCTLAHFAVGADAPGAPADPRVAALMAPPGRSYSLCVPVAPGGDPGARVRAARLHQRLLQQLDRGPLKRCQLHRLLCYTPGGGGAGALQQGVLLHDPSDSPDTRRALLALLDSYLEAPRPCLGEFLAGGGDAPHQLWQRRWELLDGQGWRQVEREPVGPALEPDLHPVVPDLPSAGVFPHREAARTVLEAVSSPLPSAGPWGLRVGRALGRGCLPDPLPPGRWVHSGAHTSSWRRGRLRSLHLSHSVPRMCLSTVRTWRPVNMCCDN